MKLLTQAQWAKQNGISRALVKRLVRSGEIQLVDGLLDSDQADTALNLHTALLKTKIKNEIERGKILAARTKAISDEFVSAEDLKAAMLSKAKQVHDRMFKVPGKVSALIAASNDAHEIHTLLSKEIRSALEELSRNTNSHE